MPKVSIIVPVYNGEKYLNRCMDSLLNQTLEDIEIIMVDDGSPDNCPALCDQYANRDSRIKVIHKKNAGLGYARNSGLEVATGEYVAFVDSDDFISTDTYLVAYKEAQKENVDVVFWGIKTEYAPGKWKKRAVEKKKQWKGGAIKDYMLDIIACAPHVKSERLYSMSVWHSIFKRSIIEKNKIRFLSERDVVSEDMPFMVDVLKQCNNVVYITNCFYHYCLNGSSLTMTFKPEKYERFRYLYKLLLEKVDFEENAIKRVDRFFIGYTRCHLLLLVGSSRSDKLCQMKQILSDPIWLTMQKRYKPQWLPLFQNIFLRLMYMNNVYLLYLFSRFANLMKGAR